MDTLMAIVLGLAIFIAIQILIFVAIQAAPIRPMRIRRRRPRISEINLARMIRPPCRNYRRNPTVSLKSLRLCVKAVQSPGGAA
jgi:hypothetical protein